MNFMKKANFLNKLREERKLELVEPSEEIKEAYLIKAGNCLKSAKILLQNGLYENSVTEAYFAMYNCVLALLYKVGIKSENHSASIVLVGKLFKATELFKAISSAKEERIDQQYYVESEQKHNVTKGSCNDMVTKTEDFMIKTKLLVGKMNNEDVNRIRKDFEGIFK